MEMLQRHWLDLVQMLAIVVLWLRRPGVDAKTAVDALAGRVDVMDERLKHMPSSDELHRVEGMVLAMQGQLTAVQGSQSATQATVTRIEQYLLHSK
jgi:hypothetical protein